MSDFKLSIGNGPNVDLDLTFNWTEGQEAIAYFGNFAVVMSEYGSVLVIPKDMQKTIKGMGPDHDRVVTPKPEPGEDYEKAFNELLAMSLEYYPKDAVRNALPKRVADCVVYKVKVLTQDEEGNRSLLDEGMFAATTPEEARKAARDKFWDERLTGHYLCTFVTEEVDDPCWYCLEREAPGECGECGINVCCECQEKGACCDG
jgi:hypothetical protein